MTFVFSLMRSQCSQLGERNRGADFLAKVGGHGDEGVCIWQHAPGTILFFPEI